MKRLTDEKGIDYIVKIVAEKCNVSSLETEQICRTQFKFMNEQMANKEFKTLMLIYLGKFTKSLKYTKEGNIMPLEERMQAKINEELKYKNENNINSSDKSL